MPPRVAGHIDAADGGRRPAAGRRRRAGARGPAPIAVSLRVERQGALVEIDVALRDVRGLADDAAAYRALSPRRGGRGAGSGKPVLSRPIAAPRRPCRRTTAPAPSEDLTSRGCFHTVEKGKVAARPGPNSRGRSGPAAGARWSCVAFSPSPARLPAPLTVDGGGRAC